MNESPGSLELLASRMDELEKRVHALEHTTEDRSLMSKPAAVPTAISPGIEDAPLQTANVFPVLGRALLGIAGAYVLRAIAETGFVPRLAVAAAAIVYALAWLVWAATFSKGSKFVPLIYTGTSAAILAPMLWEITLHFHVLTPTATAVVLTGFITLATVLGAHDGLAASAWIAQCVGCITAIALALATHAILPFLFALLVALIVIEYARTVEHPQTAWTLIALATDAAIWGAIFIYSGPQNARAEYPELSIASLVLPGCVLFAISATSVCVRTIVQGIAVRVVEIIQVMIAFGLAISSVLLFAPKATTELGIVCAIMSAGAYFASFQYLRALASTRNYLIIGAWAAALLIAGAMWMLPLAGAAIMLAIAGSAAYLVAVRTNSKSPALHGALFLCTAAILSGVPQHVFSALASSLEGRPSLAVWVIAICAVAAYAIGSDTSSDGWAARVLHFVPAFLAASTISALLVQGVLILANFATALNPHHIAFLRTLAISAMSLGLAYAGSRWGRLAMTRLAYVALAFIAAKLVFEDLRHGHMEFIAASIFLFALTLIAVPRLVRRGAMSHAAANGKTAVPVGS
ncbi:hypothetical protein P8935_01900 [Telmatobacter sp. DSM 110680]|uniref:DUF2339 domain-containing protein n=1 Tax=Telmatobacter sp. DSM 110680 TaxID=3036704 RepID=A0AAU7DLC9_9BACT